MAEETIGGPPPEGAMEYLDVLVVGAGISGIGAGYHLQTFCPGRTYAIFEGREALGGTWDLFRYPGVRSDSDMFTLGYGFKPWTAPRAIADGASILEYLKETVREHGIERRIRYGHKVTAAAWDSQQSRWTVEFDRGPGSPTERITCNFLFMCTGYYNYAKGHRPHFPDEERFLGPIVEPQFWPADLDFAGKRLVVIGSGATAVTLVPALASTAARVTMLQRSPTYVVSRPGEDPLARRLRRWLPAKLAYHVMRWRNVLGQMYIYDVARKKPEATKKAIVDMARAALGPDYDVDTHFTPSYNPWTQRLCLVPDSDLFEALKAGRAEVVTDTIECFTPGGIALRSGGVLEADIIIAATGLEMQVLSGATFTVDGQRVEFGKTFNYKGMMFSGVPNLASVFGYINASWTLKADIIARHVCRILNYMDRKGYAECRPVNDDPEMAPAPWFDFSSGYIQRALESFPKMGPTTPWVAHQNYVKDLLYMRPGAVEDGVLRFSAPSRPRVGAARETVEA
ncbi:MAG: NAD(P)/FAD-dependent oxidoreductase [Pseudomonadota bacterium]|nr:NAD(P)/FAD-dependent oxidoreductase [Pseudomonadota bacterium]